MIDEAMKPDDVVAAAVSVEAALRPIVNYDWSVRAGMLEWDVDRTISHIIGAPAKYTLYLASRCEHFIAFAVQRWRDPDVSNDEVIDSVLPIATGLATVAAFTPPDVRAFHVTGPSSAADYVGRACIELLVHTEDVLSGFGLAFAPPADLCQRVLDACYPDASGSGNPWHGLLAVNGRPTR
jgi:uncharacterized protein (TIGR03083 family)